MPEPATRSLTVLETRISRFGLGGDAGADVHRDPSDLAVQHLALPGVQARPDLQPQFPHGLGDGQSAADRPRRSVETGQEPVAGRIDLPTAETHQLTAHQGVVAPQQFPPGPVPQCRATASAGLVTRVW